MRTEEDDVALKLVHTADWHLGLRFRQFEPEDAVKLRRARLEVVDRILGEAVRYQADAVLCAGDLFDDRQPEDDWWEGLAKILSNPRYAGRPVFLLPGNHDPYVAGSVWDPAHPFRKQLPAHVHVVDRDDFSFPLGEGAVLHAIPCRSLSSSKDQALALPERTPGDERIRIGMVHGSTFDMPDAQTNFPIAQDAVRRRGFDYLAIGDTHGFRIVPPDARPPTVYPGAPEPTKFGEDDAGHVAVVFMTRRRLARVEKVPVARWRWEAVRVTTLDQLRALHARDGLQSRVLKLEVDLVLPPRELQEAERLLRELKGTEAVQGRAGIVQLRQRLELDATDAEALFADLPETLQATARRLQEATGGTGAEVARRALQHLYELARATRSERRD
ncbi:MAG TPA: DNA repair exonuclease [Myxococcaceae bacterium]|jgi:DNA repair exonuclease SbcCD nuclease subunit